MPRQYRNIQNHQPIQSLSSFLTKACALAALVALSACGGSGDSSIAGNGGGGGGPGASGTFLEICASPSISDEQIYTITELFASFGLNPQLYGCRDVLDKANEEGTINLANTGIKDVSPLVGFSKVDELDISGNIITDLSPLDLPNLMTLKASYNSIPKLPDLRKLPRLSLLYLGHNPITDLSGIEGLGEIGVLELSETAVRDWSELAKLPRLHMLSLNSLTHPASIATLPARDYTRLELKDNGLTSYGFIAKIAPELRTLLVSENAINKLEDAALFPKLTNFDASSNAIRRVETKHLSQTYESLDLSSNPIEDFGALAAVAKASFLILNNTGLRSVAPISHLMAEAGFVDISSTKVTSVDFGLATTWANMVYFDLSDNAIASLAPLAKVEAEELKYFMAYDVEAVGKEGLCPEFTGPVAVQRFCRDGYH